MLLQLEEGKRAKVCFVAETAVGRQIRGGPLCWRNTEANARAGGVADSADHLEQLAECVPEVAVAADPAAQVTDPIFRLLLSLVPLGGVDQVGVVTGRSQQRSSLVTLGCRLHPDDR